MSLKSIVNVFFEWGLLKFVARSGWWLAGVKYPESVAAHMGRSTPIGMVLAVMEGVDPGRVACMTGCHDIGETRLGDQNKVTAKYVNKKKAERRAVVDQTRPMGKPIADYFIALFDEFEAGETREAMVARDAELLEMVLEANMLVENGHPIARDWITRTYDRLRTASAMQLFKEIEKTSAHEWWRNLKKF